jgi:hypothetical protein
VERGHPAMHVAKIERRHGERVYTYWLVRRSVREGKRVRHETVANVSKLPVSALEALRRALAGEALASAWARAGGACGGEQARRSAFARPGALA